MSSQPWDAAAFRAAVSATLDAFIEEQAAQLGPLGEDADLLLAQARRSVAGGKRLRAAFCYWGYRAVRPPEDEPALLRAVGALELLHASALVHDDYMDASDTRRGRPATHKALEALHRERGWSGDARQYGAAGAILLGDLLLSWSEEMLRSSGLPDGPVRAAQEIFDATRSEVITGQFLDVSAQARGNADVDAAMRVLRFKSAKYTVERPLHLGAALAGGGADLQRELSAVGLPLGEAFQLRDDLLGVFGDPDVTGKPAGDDLSEGKRTVLVALSLQGAGREDAKRLEGKLGTALSADDVAELRRIIDESGAHAEVERRITALTERALGALADASVTREARVVLRELAEAATQRVV
ncbi:MAG TPA: polyprenyl synthetase family protein [Nocardioidaceae bacterium]|nr:polyprenyl synthetase family protein [Nocardioidaceae bacterium]